jgi:formylglycine-generating enzyme required for sulfatase activity
VVLLAVFVVFSASLLLWGGRALCKENIFEPSNVVCKTLNRSSTSIEPIEPLKHEMVLIPEGEFITGSGSNEHVEILDQYFIDKYEITNAQYKRCVEADMCRPPVNSVFDLPEREQYPVTNINLEDAKQYCSWIGGYLPSDLQWEKAARGESGFEFPWGDDQLEEGQANICDSQCPESLRVENIDDGYAQKAPVGSFPNGASPYGILDMVGNVWEWTSEGYARGGSWMNDRRLNKATSKTEISPEAREDSLGFRCARDNQ